MKIERCVQGSPEWFQTKCGRVTASRVADVMRTLKKGGESETRRKLKLEIAAERMTERMSNKYVNAPMQWGVEHEPIARTEYENKTGQDVSLVGFVYHPTIEWSGCSPDGLLTGKRKGVEYKCPETTTHIDYLVARRLSPEYEPQVMWNLACTEYDAWDFVSFDPRMPKKHQLLIVTVQRDDKRIAELNQGVVQFLSEVDELIEKLLAGENYYINKLEESLTAVTR